MKQQAGPSNRTPTIAGWAAFAVALIVLLQGVFILIIGVDQSERTLAITVIAVGLQTSLLFWFAMRRGQRVATPVLWVFPAMLFAWSIHFLANGDLGIGAPNLVFALLSAVAIFMARPKLTYKRTISSES
jgi:hypothetical protein